MVLGYIRTSTADQSKEGQKSLIARYVVERKMIVDEWIEATDARWKSLLESPLRKEKLPNYWIRSPLKILLLFPSFLVWGGQSKRFYR